MAEDNQKFVSVGCKLPHGLRMELKAKDGAITQAFTVVGANHARIIGGYGITEMVPADFVTEWLRRNAKHPAVVNGSIFVHADTKSAEAMAKERGNDIVTGLEAIDPVKTGMLKGADGEVDKAALKKYNEAKAQNPERNRQRAE